MTTVNYIQNRHPTVPLVCEKNIWPLRQVTFQNNNYRPRTEYDGKVMFWHVSVCLATGGGVSQLGGGGFRSSRGGGVMSSQRGGGVRSSQGGSGPASGGRAGPGPAGGGQRVRSSRGGSGPAGGGSGPAGGGGGPAGQLGGVSQWGGGGHYTAGGMPLAFTQEDFLVNKYNGHQWDSSPTLLTG